MRHLFNKYLLLALIFKSFFYKMLHIHSTEFNQWLLIWESNYFSGIKIVPQIKNLYQLACSTLVSKNCNLKRIWDYKKRKSFLNLIQRSNQNSQLGRLVLLKNKHEPCKRSWCPMIKPCKFWFEYICFLAFFFHFYFSLNFNFFCFNCLYPIIMTIPLVGLGGRNWSYGKCPKFHSFLYGFP